jgi:flagellar motor switch/type III secretory pathway protein FliN
MSARRIREIRFERRSSLPVSAACLIATAVRESLAPVFGAGFTVRLFPPALPAAAAWAAIVRDAYLYLVRGSAGEAVIVLRKRDAATLAAAAFGEHHVVERAVSPIEEATLQRIAAMIAQQLAPVCGPGVLSVARCSQPGTLVTYFELQCDAPVHARIGIGLRHDPPLPGSSGSALADLSDVPLDLRASVAAGVMTAAAIAALRPGDVIPLPPGSMRASLLAAGRALGFGECGVSGNRFALFITAMSQGSPAR